METEQTITVYRRPGTALTHFPGDEGRTFCKHYKLAKMDELEHPVTFAALWCTDCTMAMIRFQQGGHDDPDATASEG